MTVSFNDLKRSSTSSFEKLNQELTKLNTNTNNNKDDRMWSCQTDKAGNGYAVIRFLPAPQGEDLPFVRIWNHGFQGPGGWYIENSLTTIGGSDPIGDLNTRLWNSGIESDKEVVRKQKRKLSYYSNIYVVKDPANPDNEGKTFIFRYGKKIFDKINDLMHPQFEDEKAINPFDFWAGANFRLKIRQVEGYANYDKSEFESVAPLFEDDDKLEAVWKGQHSLKELLDPKNFKSVEELQKRLDRALGNTPAPAQKQEFKAEEAPKFKERESKPVPSASSDEDDDDFMMFKKLAESDD
jgi:hypothetical protein